ncbi:MAG: trypsin-like serine peptidase [Bdellovibrionales bacterium]
MFGLFVLFFSYLVGFAQTGPSGRNIVGQDDFLTVNENLSNIPEKWWRLADSVGRFSMGCTGTHLGRGLVATAGHCFDASQNITQNSACEKVQIRWGYRGSTQSTLVSQCLRIIAMQNRPGIDYALVEVSPPPPSWVNIDPRPLSLDQERATLFSHPKGRPLQWSRYCRTKKLDPPPRDARFIYHECDTQPGSSGAAVVLENTGRVVALHKGGAEIPNLGTWNFATRLTETPIPQIIIWSQQQRRR